MDVKISGDNLIDSITKDKVDKDNVENTLIGLTSSTLIDIVPVKSSFAETLTESMSKNYDLNLTDS
jgi:hypothetical protein